jgi:hypothetical protein
MLDEFEAADLRRTDQQQRRRDKALVAHVWSRSQFDEQFPDDGEYPNPNQPRCTAGANGALAARKAIALVQERMEKK